MAIDSSLSLTAFVLFVLMLCLPLPSVAVPSEELEIAISVLRVRGRALFANAITTSDILFDLLSAESLTLLVPTDAMLFDLDMRYSLPMYISTLRLHALPLRLTISELRSLPNASSVPTFLPSHSLLLTKPSSSDSVYLDGVEVYLPGLFNDQHIAVHGLANILPLSRSRWAELENRAFALPPMVDSPSFSPSYSPAYSPSFSPSYSPSPRSTWWISPSPEDYIEFFGRTPAEPPRIGEVPVSQPPLEEDLIVGDGDSWTTGF
ncbi:fasciclin-like arabinogalactan protein 19 [Brassica rapa]|uniref:FAS1 domain-containing protein n=1 Tax=Brassica campestris TaxID=3711 RepID=M4DCX8_BRACM|nr:fasciclin-like arabinogalactan protein 19 [Brassica rapa]